MALAPLFDPLMLELKRSSSLSSTLLVLSLLLFAILILFSVSRSDKKHKLPPTPTRLPIIGNLHQLGKLPHQSLHALSKKYGPLMLLHFGQVPTLVVSSAAMAKEIMTTHDTIFCSRPKSTAANILFYKCQDIGFSPYGEYWKKVRQLCVHELLSTERVQQFQYAREEEVEELLKSIRKCCLVECPINLSEMLTRTSNNILSRCVINKRFVGGNDNWFGELTQKVVVQLTTFTFGDFFPCLRWVDNITGVIAHLKSTSRKLDAFFDQLIEEHKTTKGEGGEPKSNDFVDILLKNEKNGMLDLEFTNENLKAVLQDMFLGGSDSVSTTLEWLVAELILNSRVMKKLQQEIRRVVKKKGKVDANDTNQMKYLKCVIKETLRLHPPAPFLLPRETTKDVTLGGYYIHVKTIVLVNAFAIHRDPKLWERPEEFLPERFEDERFDIKGKLQNFQFIPFGGGRRVCPGQAFGMAALENVVANLLYWFDWKLPSDNVLAESMTKTYGVAIHKKVDLIPILYIQPLRI